MSEEAVDLQVNDLAEEQEGTITITTDSFSETPEETPQETSSVPEKFQNEDGTLNTDALLKSYTELEKTRMEPKVDTPEETPEEPKEAEGFDLQPYYDKWGAGNAITDEDVSKISEGMGVSDDLVRSYVELHTNQRSAEIAKAEADADTRIYATVGGEESYKQMVEWASTNLSEGEMSNLNLQLDNPVFAETGAKLLKSLYENANGKEPSVKIDPPADVPLDSQDPNEFYSQEEVRAAQRDPKYLSGDPRTHALFDAKLARFLARKG